MYELYFDFSTEISKKRFIVSLSRDQAIELVTVLNEFFDNPAISVISTKKFLTTSELALYFGRSVSWIAKIKKKGLLMEKKHYHRIGGLIMYNREEIEKAIISNSL